MRLFITPIFLLLLAGAAIADNWRVLAPGIEYQDLGEKLLSPWSHIHVFRIDLKNNELDLITAKNIDRKFAKVDEFSQHSNALITINGGFFDHNHHPLGLRISHQQQKNPLKRISWWGVFYVENQKPYLSSMNQYKNDNNIDFALQSGPRLLVDGTILSLKPGLAERTALGISTNNRIIILVSENNPMTTTELAELMKSSPLDCLDALNLDGGGSSQIKADVGSFKLHAPGLSNVSDAIIVKARA